MASEIQARAIISAVDRTSGPLGRIAGRFRAFGNRLGVDRLNRQFASVGRSIGNVGREVARLGRLATIGVAAVGGAALALTRNFANAADETAKLARELGTTPQFLRRIEYAAKMAGAEFGAIQSGLQRITQTAATGQLESAIRRVDPALADMLKGTKNAEEGFHAIVRAMKDAPSVSRRNAIAAAAFGRSASEAMIRLADADLDDLFAAADRDRGVLPRSAFEAAERFNDAWSRVGQTIEGVRDAIGSRLAEVLEPVLNQFADWIAANRELIAEKVEEWITWVVEGVKELALELPGLVTRIENLVKQINEVVESIGGWRNVLIGVAGVITGKLTLALVGLIAQLGLFGKALLTTPIGWIFLGIGLAIAGVTKRWDDFKNAIEQGWSGLGDIFGGLGEIISGALTFDGAKMMTGVRRVGNGIRNLLEGNLRAAGSVLKGVVERFEEWTGIDVTGWVSNLLSEMESLVDGALGKAAELIRDTVQWFRDLINIDIGEWARSMGESFREYVIKPFEDFASFLRNSRLGQWLGFADDVEQEGEDAAERAREMGRKVGSMVARGMRDAKPEIDAAAREMTQGIADYLPQSPAKKGPLRRLVKMGQEIVAQLSRGIEMAAALLPHGLVDGISSAVRGMGQSVARGAQTVFEAPGRAVDNIREMASGPFKALLDMIGSVEAPRGYNQIFGGAESRLGRQNLTGMTIREVQDLQNRMVRSGAGSSAVGRYQIIRGTLNSLINELGLSGNEKFDETMQDRLGTALLQRRGARRFMDGSLSLERFGNNLSKEWAALPFLTGNRRGRSYYHGDSMGNRAHLAPAHVERTLSTLRNRQQAPRSTRPELENRERSQGGRRRGDVNITISSMTLNAENPHQAADEFWRELERRRGSSLTDPGVD